MERRKFAGRVNVPLGKLSASPLGSPGQKSAELGVRIVFGVRSGRYKRDTSSGICDGKGSALVLITSFREVRKAES